MMVQNKITIDQLATALADMVFKKISETSLAPLSPPNGDEVL